MPEKTYQMFEKILIMLEETKPESTDDRQIFVTAENLQENTRKKIITPIS
jgi:hypothetical protein